MSTTGTRRVAERDFTAAANREARFAGHAHVQQCYVNGLFFQKRQCLNAIVRRQDAIALQAQQIFEGLADFLVVIGDEDGSERLSSVAPR